MTTARDWFADEYEFRQLCGDAQSQAKGESSQDFAAREQRTVRHSPRTSAKIA